MKLLILLLATLAQQPQAGAPPVRQGQSTVPNAGQTRGAVPAPEEPHPPLPPPSAPTTAPPRTAAELALEEETKNVAAQLRCPVCQGLSIQDSPSELARQMKDVVREKLRAGETADQVKAYYVSKYGEWVLLTPPARGFNLAVYLLPFGALLGGIVLVFVLARRWIAQGQRMAGSDATREEEETPVL
jgi:cytochrome c-type biogenesis protein CcmH/NrfF